MSDGVKITQLSPWNKGATLEDDDLFEIASEGNSFKISASTISAAILNKLQDTLDKYALKDSTVGYPALKSTSIPKWKVTDSSLFETLYSNNSFMKNMQIDGTLNNTRSYLYSDDFEREQSGFSVWKSVGGWNIECDTLYVRKAIKAKEYVIESISSLKGTMVLSAANGEIKYVEEDIYDGKEVYQVTFEGDVLSYKEDDIILCQTYGDRANPATQRRYIAVVQSITDDGKAIRLNKSDFLTEAGIPIQSIPTVGDETVQYGNIKDVDRQGVIQLSAAYNIDGSGSKPYISIITDINGRFDINTGIEDLVQGNISTVGRTRSVFGHLKDIQYDPTTEELNPSSGFGVLTDNGLYRGRMIATSGNIINLLTIGGNVDQYWNVSGGKAGLYGGNEPSEKRANSTTAPVRLFCGNDYTNAQKGLAPIIIKEDGSGLLASGNISWDDAGNTKIVGELSIVTPSGNKDLIEYIGGISNELQNQIDKAIESWFYPFDAADNKPPVTIWLDEYTSTGRPLASILKQHIGDTFTNVWDGTSGTDPNTGYVMGGTPGASWRWTIKTGTTGDNISDYQWTRITETALQEVLNKIGKLDTQVDSKITTFVTSYTEHNKNGIAADQPPFNYKKGDMWYNINTSSILVATVGNPSYNFNDWSAVVDKSLSYIKDAIKQTTTIQGGVVLTSILGVGAYQTADGTDVWSDKAGLCGLLGNDPTAIRFYAGASLGSRRTVSDAELSTVPIPFFIRQDGAGRVGGLVFKDGVITSITTGNSIDVGNSKFQILGDRINGTLATANQPTIDKLLFSATVGTKDSIGNHIIGSITLESMVDQGFVGNWTGAGTCKLNAEGIVITTYSEGKPNYSFTYEARAIGQGQKTVKSFSAINCGWIDNNDAALFVGATEHGVGLRAYSNIGSGIDIITNFNAMGITSQAPFEVYNNQYYSASMYAHKGYAHVGAKGLDFEAVTIKSVSSGSSRLSFADLSNVVMLMSIDGNTLVDMPLATNDGAKNPSTNVLCSFEVKFIGLRRVDNDSNTVELRFFGWNNASATTNDYLYYYVGEKNQGPSVAANGTLRLAGADFLHILFCPGLRITQSNGISRPTAYIYRWQNQ